MKKIMLALSLALGGSTIAAAVPSLHMSAEATSTATFAKAMKKGKLPGAKGKVGMTYKQLKKQAPKLSKYQAGDPIGVADLGQFQYGFLSGKSSATVQLIKRDYYSASTISKATLEKKLGKPYDIEYYYGNTFAYYKSGKYVVAIVWRPASTKMTTVVVGKRKVVENIIIAS